MQRNFEAVLDLMACGQLDVKPLISHRFAFEQALEAYAKLTEDKSSLGILLDYTSEDASRAERKVRLSGDDNFEKQANHGFYRSR